MLNPKQPQKKGFRAFAERDNERKLAEESGAAENMNAEPAPATEPVAASPVPPAAAANGR